MRLIIRLLARLQLACSSGPLSFLKDFCQSEFRPKVDFGSILPLVFWLSLSPVSYGSPLMLLRKDFKSKKSWVFITTKGLMMQPNRSFKRRDFSGSTGLMERLFWPLVLFWD